MGGFNNRGCRCDFSSTKKAQKPYRNRSMPMYKHFTMQPSGV